MKMDIRGILRKRRKQCFILLLLIKIMSVFALHAYLNIMWENKYLQPEKLPLDTYYKIELKNIPDNYRYEQYKRKSNRTCAPYPKLLELKIQNDYWQQQETSKGVFSLFNAYVDDRTEHLLVRILGTFNKKIETNAFFCQFWYHNEEQPIIIPTKSVLMIFENEWFAQIVNMSNLQVPYVISCPVKTKVVPTSVSLVEKYCDLASNNLKILYNKNKTHQVMKNFVVCVKGLVFPFEDRSIRLIEWIELLKLLGADKINFYKFNVESQTETVLEYYSQKKNVEVTPVKYLDISNTPQMQLMYVKNSFVRRRLQEVITYNDCFYKHMYQYKYVVLLDIDEVVMPRNGTWVDIIKTLELSSPNKASYIFQNAYFFDSFLKNEEYAKDIPKYMYMLQHVYRSLTHSLHGHYVKGFHSTKHVVTLHNHFALTCLAGQCLYHYVSVKDGNLQHYRSDCHEDMCRKYQKRRILDTAIWKFKKELIQRMQTVMAALGYFKWY